MSYQESFMHADDVVEHLNSVIPHIEDSFLQLKYTGFVTVSAVTVYELAIKKIFIDFSKKKHKVLHNFTEFHFERINGRIRTKNITEEYLPRFGQKYVDRFKKKLDKITQNYIQTNRRDIKSSYNNLIIWRNEFAHEGRMQTTATYSEVVQAYKDGKEVIRCLAEAMTR